MQHSFEIYSKQMQHLYACEVLQIYHTVQYHYISNIGQTVHLAPVYTWQWLAPSVMEDRG